MNILSCAPNIENDSDLSVFVHDVAEDVPEIIKRGIGYINHMIDLEYMTLSTSGYSFTKTGLDYMLNKHSDYLEELATLDTNELSLLDFLPLIHQARSRKFTDPLMGQPLDIPIFNESSYKLHSQQLNYTNKISISTSNDVDWNKQLPDRYVEYGRKDPSPPQ